jgi:high-affinity nickel-transport protein
MERQPLLGSHPPTDDAIMDAGAAERTPMLKKLQTQAEYYHNRIPWIRRLPGPALAIIALLVGVQLVVWTAVGIVLHFHTALVSTAVLSYTLGLRHALDADHISAIDLMTRRLVAAGQRPVTVGTYFSLGHSTIVVVTSVVVAASSAAIQNRFDGFGRVGGIIGSSISAAFLMLLGSMNAWILYKLHQQLRAAIAAPGAPEGTTADLGFQGGGCMTMLLRRTFTLVDRPWKMYPLGVLFGLGFDTSSEVALLGISSIQAARGTSIWLILIFPVLFTSGMCLLDTFDGAAMMSLYTSARLAQDAIAVLYYQCVLTAITVAVAISIGSIQLLTMIHNVRPDLDGPFWDGVDVAGDHYDIIGGSICGSFVVFGVLAVVLYKPWRRRVDQKRRDMFIGVGDDEETPDSDRNDLAHGQRPAHAATEWRSDTGKSGAVQTTVRSSGEPSKR